MKRRHIAHILGVLFLALIADFLYSKYGLTVSSYSIATPKISDGFRIVQLSDLHNSVFGKNNCRLISKVIDEKPDIIIITGDLVNSHGKSDLTIATQLISDLSEIAPVYISFGNQEKEMEEKYKLSIDELYTNAGATVLEYSYIDLDINKQKVRLGGIYGYCQIEAYSVETHREYESDYLSKFQKTDRYTILMCHMPVNWVAGDSLYDWNIDAVFAGHSHGGQIRIPFVGGLWAPDQGWFPGKMAGLYTTSEELYDEYLVMVKSWIEKMHEYNSRYDAVSNKYETMTNQDFSPSCLVLSRGLGNTDKVPRFNNVPEIVVVDFVPDEE